jgi:hypothetical protein
MSEAGRKDRGARFVVVLFAPDGAEIAAQGATLRETFRREFLDPYQIEGERWHPGEGATVCGALLASDESVLVTVPIRTWEGEDGTPQFLCQGSDDGSPPALSMPARSESELIDHLARRLSALH